MATKDYKQLAQQEVDPVYQQKVQALKNSLATQLTNLENQRGQINQGYDTQVQNQGLQNTLGKNNFSNTMLGRGMGRSSIVGTGLAGMDARNERMVGQINMNRNNSIQNLDNSKTTLQNNMESSIAGLEGERVGKISELARALEDRDWERNYKMMALRGSSGGGSGSSGTPNIRAGSDYSDALNTAQGYMGNSYSPDNIAELQRMNAYFANDTTKEGQAVRKMIQQALAHQQQLETDVRGRAGYVPANYGQSSASSKTTAQPKQKVDAVSGADVNLGVKGKATLLDAITVPGAMQQYKQQNTGWAQLWKALTQRF